MSKRQQKLIATGLIMVMFFCFTLSGVPAFGLSKAEVPVVSDVTSIDSLIIENSETNQSLENAEAITLATDDYNMVGRNFENGTTEFIDFQNYMEPMAMRNIMEEPLRMTEGFMPFQNPISLSPQTIIGEDSRSLVANTTINPYRSICRVEMTYNNVYNQVTHRNDTRTYIGTAFFVGPNVLMTAGHVLYSDVTTASQVGTQVDVTYDDGVFNPRFPDSIVVQPAVYGTISAITLPYGEFEVSQGYIQKEYYTGGSNNFDYDWGVLKIDEDIGYQLGYMSLSAYSGNGKPTNTLHVAGYPGDKEPNMFEADGNITDVTDYQYRHDADTTGGMSGSPMYYQRSGNSYNICSIHVGYTNALFTTYNISRRIDSFIIDFVLSVSDTTPDKLYNYYYDGTDKIYYNCGARVIYDPLENTSMQLSQNGSTYNRTISNTTQEFYTSTTTSTAINFPYSYYRLYYLDTGIYSQRTSLFSRYVGSNRNAQYKITDKTAASDFFSTSYDQTDNMWEHGGSTGDVIKGTVAYNGEAKNIEVTIPWVGTNESAEVVVGGITFRLRTGPNKVSIKASRGIYCNSTNILFAFSVV